VREGGVWLWAMIRRWAVETAFKRLYGEYCMSRNMERELNTKAYIYNMLINRHAR
jgi:hypothetical protein